MTVAVHFTVWNVLVALADNFLRPILIGRGSEVPLAVILTGALGGLLAYGLTAACSSGQPSWHSAMRCSAPGSRRPHPEH